MPLCHVCRETYREGLPRCPNCGAREGDVADAPAPFEVNRLPWNVTSVSAHARRLRRFRLIAFGGAAGVGLLAFTVFALPQVLWPASAEGASRDAHVITPPPPPPAEREAVEKTFKVDRVERWGEKVLVEGACAPTAVVEVRVDNHPARIEPDGQRFRALLDYSAPVISVEAIGLDDERAEVEVEVPELVPGLERKHHRILSHPDGATVHTPNIVVREMLADQPGAVWDRTVELEGVETFANNEEPPTRYYRLPEGLVATRMERSGNLVVLRLRDHQEMVLIPAGLGYRGHGTGPPYGPRHVFSQRAFLIDRTEVTCAQFARFLAQVARVNDRIYRHPEDPGVSLRPIQWPTIEAPEGEGDLPVRGVNWYAAWAYARWVGGRLPTEAEWERAAAGPEGRPYPWGSTFDPVRVRCQAPGPLPAASLETGASPYGLLNMAGNVREWCEDRYDPRWLLSVARTNPVGPPQGGHRVVRGGSFASSLDALMTPCREHALPTPHPELTDVGFRVARDFSSP